MAEDAHIVSEIHIDAEPEDVWAVLMDYEALPEWSNGFFGTDKPMAVGEISTAYFKNPITHGRLEFTHEVVIFEENRAFGWSGDIGHGRNDYHVYEMEPHPEGGTTFRQRDGMYGKPSSIFTHFGEHAIRHSYEAFNKRLKARVEGLKSNSV